MLNILKREVHPRCLLIDDMNSNPWICVFCGHVFCIEDAIVSSVDIPSNIACYQKTLGYASTPFDFVCRIGLYLMPSDMALRPGNGTTTRSRLPDQRRLSDTTLRKTRRSRSPPKAIRHSKGRPPHQLGPLTRDHSLRSSFGTRRMTRARQRLTHRRNDRGGWARPAGRRRPRKKKTRPMWPLE